MSGGSFNYAYSHVQYFADELRWKISANETPDRYGDAHRFSSAVLHELAQLEKDARSLSEKMRAAEWLYSSDIGEETFLQRIGSPHALVSDGDR